MGKIKDFIEKNSKMIEVTFSFISLVIVGVFGTTISINNSITSKASLELSKANSQPVYSVKSESNDNDGNLTEALVVNVDGGFAENLSIKEYTWFEYSYKLNDVKKECKVMVDDYFMLISYTGNNRGEVARTYNTNNSKYYVKLFSDCLTYDDGATRTLGKNSLLAITYKDISGNTDTKYYETKGGYFNHIDSSVGKKTVAEFENLPKKLLEDITIDELDKLAK